MRSVALGLCVIGLAGCATVSMVPGQATVETNLSVQQSALRTSSDAFYETARESGWVEKSTGLAGLARILMHGQDEAEDAPSDYSERVGAETEPPANVFSRVVTDSEAAREGLSDVAEQAVTVLNSELEYGRSDIVSFERSLVTAQKAHRSFSRAADLAATRNGGAPETVDAALARLATEIDEARRVADQLADRYASIDVAVS